MDRTNEISQHEPVAAMTQAGWAGYGRVEGTPCIK